MPLLRALIAITIAVIGLNAGCMKKVLLDGQLRGTRQASPAINTLQDFEVAKAIGRTGLGTLEGLHVLEPDNLDGILMLARGWSGATLAFTEDEYEEAQERGEEVLARYHLLRMRGGFQRARFYGDLLLDSTTDGFAEAQRNAETLQAWLKKTFTHQTDAENLLWAGFARVGFVAAARDAPEAVADLWIGVEILKRSVELDDRIENATAHIVLGAYHGRSQLGELDDSLRHFERALAVNGGKYLPTQLTFARSYHCARSDRASYRRLLEEVIAAGDTLPEERLANTIAKRKARRYLDSDEIFSEDCGFID